MTEEGWGKLITQDEEFLHKRIARAEQQQRAADAEYAHLKILNMADDIPSHQPTFKSFILQEASAHEQAVSNLKASKLLQFVRRRRAAESRRQATASVPTQSCRSAFCSRLNLVPLRCLSMPLHSDEDEDLTHTDGLFAMSNRLCGSQSQAPRTFSCPKLGSPLDSCTPFPSRHFYGQTRDEEVLECLQSCGTQEGGNAGSNNSSKESSPLKLNLSRQPSTPKGYLALYVGVERKRFLVKASLINHPLFGLLLEMAKEEFGFEQKGPLNIPCEIAFFQHIMLLIESNDPFYWNADRSTVLLHLNNAMATTLV